MNGGPPSVDGGAMAECLALGASRHPETSLRFVGGARPVDVRLDELGRAAHRVAAGLERLGIGAGDRVAIWVPNWVEGAITYQAAWLVGAVAVPIVHIYGPREVGFILRESAARMLVMPDRWRDIDYRERFAAIDPIVGVEHLVVITDEFGPTEIPWSSLADVAAAPDRAVERTPDDDCLIVYTSGTTGVPKGVRHTTSTLVAEVESVAAVSDWGLDTTTPGMHLAAFPAGHIAGVLGLLRTVLLGIPSVILDRWDAVLAAELIDRHRVVASSGAPFYLASLLDAAERDGRDLSSLRSYLVGAGSVPRALVERADRAGVPVFRSYGSTEHPTVTIGHPSDPLERRAGTDGRATPGTEIRIVDDDGDDVASGVDGEIVTRGPELFVGYTDPAIDEGAFLPGRWYRTGDIGHIDADGDLTITDRLKDLIIRGGENIASKEVEDLLSLHPDVAEVAAVGRPDERYGELVAVFVRTRDGVVLDHADVIEHFGRLGAVRQKTPEHLVLVDDFPRTASGKIRKDVLRDRLRP
jgi:cyclohexanecarboxylate-CoA ligase